MLARAVCPSGSRCRLVAGGACPAPTAQQKNNAPSPPLPRIFQPFAHGAIMTRCHNISGLPVGSHNRKPRCRGEHCSPVRFPRQVRVSVWSRAVSLPLLGEGGALARRMRGKCLASAPSSVACGDSFPQRGEAFSSPLPCRANSNRACTARTPNLLSIIFYLLSKNNAALRVLRRAAKSFYSISTPKSGV